MESGNGKVGADMGVENLTPLFFTSSFYEVFTIDEKDDRERMDLADFMSY